MGNSHSGLVWGFSGLSSLFFPQVRSLTSSRMAKSKASKRSLRSKDLEILKCHRCFEGTVFRCTHRSVALGLDACFSVYVPDAPRIHTTLPYPRDCEEFPVLLFLSDEGCNDIDILMQGNVLQHCSDCGLILVSADTCPREAETEGAEGVSVCGASYYVNATEKPWNTHCKMRDYLEAELLDLVHDNFPTCGSEAVSIMGHGMGGTAALSMALRKDALPFRSVSALAPLLNPTEVEVTKKTFRQLLGQDESSWRSYDPLAAVIDSSGLAPPTLVDVGSEENSNYVQKMVKPFDFISACHQSGVPVDFRLRAGFDHSFFFVASVMEEHIDFHSKHLDDA